MTVVEKYVRNPKCECNGLPSWGENRWSNGYIYSNGKAKECTCHKEWRTKNYINQVLADSHTSWDLNAILDYKYVGDPTTYNNFKTDFAKYVKTLNVLAFFQGPASSQKTITALTCMIESMKYGASVSYWTQFNLLDEITKIKNFNTDRDEAISIEGTLDSLNDKDLLIIDDMFFNVVGNKMQQFPTTTVQKFEDLIMSRKKATILISQQFPSEGFFSNAFLNKLIARLSTAHTLFKFEDIPEAVDLENALNNGTFWDSLR